MNKKTVTIKARINEGLKKSVEEKLERLGLNSSTVIRMLYSKIDELNKIPFEMTIPCTLSHIPNAETIETLKKTRKGEDLIECKDVEDMFRKLGI